ncbi:MAG: aryl-sulfate sulfotransferase [Methanoregula sp.]|nr:aryl-sulfate sulfotransferase [Methanoregula sp.]
MIPEKIAPGTTLVGDLHDQTQPRIVEVNMLGEIVWKYDIPEELKAYTNLGFSVVPLQNGNILAVFPLNGVYEINRTSKNVVWKFIDSKASHDAERLDNGNTLVVDGGYGRDTIQDAQVTEINPQGQAVWSWYAKDHGFNQAPYNTINNQGWTHTNAASRLQNGDTLISLRNFNRVVEVDRDGKIVRTIGEGTMDQQHDPEALPNGNILFANPGVSPKAVEINSQGQVVWNYIIPEATTFSSQATRDADRLQNGNTLITTANRLIEVTPQGDIVWQFRLKDIQFVNEDDAKSRGFYKAIRIPA